jgi:hypothetical protein
MLRMPRLRRPYPVLKLDLYQTSKYRIILMALNRALEPAVGARFHTKRAPDAPDGHLAPIGGGSSSVIVQLSGQMSSRLPTLPVRPWETLMS